MPMKHTLLYFSWLLFLLACSSAPNQQQEMEKEPTKTIQKEVCVTIDDLPVVNYSIKEPAHLLDITTKLIQTFQQYQIPAIGYVNESKLYLNGKLFIDYLSYTKRKKFEKEWDKMQKGKK